MLGAYFKQQDSLANISLSKNAPAETINSFYIIKQSELKGILSPLELIDYETQDYATASKFAVAIKVRNQLKIDKRMTDSLLLYLRTAKANSKKDDFNENDYEADKLGRLLTEQQNGILMRAIYKTRAQDYAKADWVLLKKYNLTKGLDSAAIYAQNEEYELYKAVFLNRIILAKNQLKDDSIRQVINITKPRGLLKLDIYKNSLPSSEFSNVIKCRKDIDLKPEQIELMLDKLIELEKLRLNYSVRYATGKFNNKPFESQNLQKILTAEQWDQYLHLKNQEKAVTNAQNDWAQLQKAGLTTGLDSAKTYTEIYKYELNWLAATDRNAFDKSQKNVFAIKDIEGTKPAILKILDAANKNIANSNATKKTLVW